MAYASIGATTEDLGGGESDDGTQIAVGMQLSLAGPRSETLFTYNPFF